MKVKIELTVAVDKAEWAETYGMHADDASEAWVRENVKDWCTNALSYHPDGLIEIVSPAR